MCLNAQVPEDRFAYLVDADFVFPASFASSLTSGRSAAQLQALRAAWEQRGQRGAMVIPAFERLHNVSAAHPAGCASSVTDIEADSSCWMYGEFDVPLTKAKLRSMVETDQSVAGFFAKRVRDRRCHGLPVLSGLLPDNTILCTPVTCDTHNRRPIESCLACSSTDRTFDSTCGSGGDSLMCMQWSASHGCYDPDRALAADAFYSFTYSHPCEPYPIALKAALPPFDQRWRGRLLDKTSYITQMAAWGFKFSVNTDAFMLHLPHPPGAPLLARPDSPKDQTFADLWALPYALTRVMLEDIAANDPQFAVHVLPSVPPLKDAEVRDAMPWYLLQPVPSPQPSGLASGGADAPQGASDATAAAAVASTAAATKFARAQRGKMDLEPTFDADEDEGEAARFAAKRAQARRAPDAVVSGAPLGRGADAGQTPDSTENEKHSPAQLTEHAGARSAPQDVEPSARAGLRHGDDMMAGAVGERQRGRFASDSYARTSRSISQIAGAGAVITGGWFLLCYGLYRMHSGGLRRLLPG